MEKSLLVLAFLASLPLLNGGCVVGGEESGTGVDSDYPFDYEVAITAQLPADAPADAAVWVAQEEAGFAAECDVDGFCTFLAFEPGTYTLTVTSETAIFLAESVTLDEAGTEPELVTWETGGCGDETWTPESQIACTDVIPGEWGDAPNGLYDCAVCGYESEIVTKNVADISGDGKADIKLSIEKLGGGTDFVVAGHLAFSIKDGYQASLTITSDLELVTLYVGPETGIFERQ